MAESTDTLWLPVLPSLRGFGPALASGADKEAEKTGKSVGKKFGLAVVGGVAAVGAGAAAAGAALYKVGEVFDEVADTIRVGTGATGDALDGLIDSAKNVGKNVPADFEKVGVTVADINTRLGLSGDTLETVASQYLEAGRILGEDVDVTKTSAAFSAFKIEGDAVVGAMDHLFQVSQATGVGMNELADGAARNAPAMEILGFSFEETTAMIGSFDKAGLNSSALMASMSKGMVTLAKDGEEPAAAFKRVQEEITGFVAAGDDAAALELASKVFGTKGASQFIGAIKSGALNLDDMSRAAGQTSDTIMGVGAETMDFAEQWMLFKNNILVWLEPMGTKVFGTLGTLMGELTAGVTAFGEAWKYNDGDITSSGIPGVMELLGYWSRQTFDYFKGTVIPNLMSFGAFLKENIETIKIISGVIGVALLPILIRLGGEAVIAGAKQVAAWLAASGGSVKAAAMYLVNSYTIIGTWVAMSLAAVKSGAETAAIWLMYRLDSIRAVAAMVAARATIIASWIMMGVQSMITGARIAAAWVLAMGPVGWVIAGIAALVAAFIGAYNNIGWFKDGVDAVLRAVGAVFTWLYQSVIAPVFSSIQTVVNGFYLFFRGVFQLVVAVFNQIIAPAFMNFWRGVVEPVFSGIASVISIWWAATKLIFDTVVGFIRTTLSTGFTWFRDSVITPVFNFILGAVSLWWAGVQIIFNAVIGFLRGTLGVAFTWLRDSIITPVWNGIRDAISNVWHYGIKPVFDFLSKAIREDVPNAFQKGVDAAKRIWDTLLDIAKKPVRFVVNTVINDGLIGAFNKVAGFLPGIDKLSRVALPAGFAEGGWTGPGGKYQPAGIVHADEFVVNKASRRAIEGRAPGLLDSLNSMGARALSRLGYANGGRVNPTKNMTLTQGFSRFHDGIDIGVGVGTPVFAADSGRITHAGPGASAPGVSGGNEVHLLANGIETWYAHLSQIGVKLGQMVTAGQQIALSGNTGISSGPHLHFGAYNGRWPNAINPLAYLSGAAMPEGGTAGSGDSGGFMDPFGALMSLAEGVMQKVKNAIPGGGFMVDAAAGIGKKLITDVVGWGKKKLGMGAVTGPQQGAHLNPLLYDEGGILRPGLSTIMNATGGPEMVLKKNEWEDIHQLATQNTAAGMTYAPTYQWAGPDPHAVMAKDKARMLDTVNIYL